MRNSSNRKASPMRLVPEPKPRSLKDRFYICVTLNAIAAVIGVCGLLIADYSTPSEQKFGSPSVAVDCFNSATGQITRELTCP